MFIFNFRPMKNKLLRIGFTLSAIGSLSAMTLCIVALFDPLFFPGLFMFFSFIILLSGFVVIFINYQNDLRRQQKICEDVELLLMTFQEVEKKNIQNQLLANKYIIVRDETDNS